jgi:lipopolysaccharide/colanic/teichoic acid biosynthesis glycosyltransferase
MVTTQRIKRLFDLLVCVPALILSLPVQGGVAAIVFLQLGRPILFKQERAGQYGRAFVMAKFRTMRPVDPARGWTDDTSRMTSVGRFLRSTSLDELPTLLNVLRGDMSLVGPRPLLLQYLDRYSPEQSRRHEVKPGLTGLAQVGGRNALTWEKKFELDVSYVDTLSMRRDLSIVAATFSLVIRRVGITSGDHCTMHEFMGTSAEGGNP